MAEYSDLSLKDLIDYNTKLSVERGEAADSIKKEQLAVQERIDELQLVERGKAFTDAELKKLAKFRKENPQAEDEPQEGEGEVDG